MRTTKTKRTVKELSDFLAKTGYKVEESQYSKHRINIREPNGECKASRMRLMPRKATKIAHAIYARHFGLASVKEKQKRWRSMTTAPKDGTRIIGRLSLDEVAAVHWDGQGFLGRNCYYEPTHWMHL